MSKIILHAAARVAAGYKFEDDGAAAWLWTGQRLIAGPHMGIALPTHLSATQVTAGSLAAVNAAASTLPDDQILHITFTVEQTEDEKAFFADWED